MEDKRKWFVGVDLGGTTIKMAFVNVYGEIIHKWEINTDTSKQGKNITTDIAKSIDTALTQLNEPKEKLAGIGMGAPGFINMETGLIYKAINIGWDNFPLKSKLEMETSLPVVVDNDANIAAIGEMWKGAGDGADDLLCVTLGTGVGGGVISKKEIIHGSNGMAGEIGHITSIPIGGSPCNCGKTGCLETMASATGIVRLVNEKLEENQDSVLYKLKQNNGKVTAKDVFIAAEENDKFAIAIVDEVCFHLGLVLANLANALNPEKIVIGGGVSKAGNILLTFTDKHFKKFTLPRVYEAVTLSIAVLGNDAGVIGGAWLAKTKQ